MRFALALIGLWAIIPITLAQEVVVDKPYVEPYKGVWLPGSIETQYIPGLPWFEPGSGILIDQQGDTLVVAIFTYDEHGAPKWYLASGPLVNGKFSGLAHAYGDGACLNCPWEPAEATVSIPITLQVIAHKLMRLDWGKGPTIFLKPLPFDSLSWDVYGLEDHFGYTAMYDMGGRWLFVNRSYSQKHVQEFQLSPSPIYLDPGGLIYDDLLPPGQTDNGYSYGSQIGCYIPRAQRIVSQCIAEEVFSEPDLDKELFSLFWGDMGPTKAIGYLGDTKLGVDGDVRGEQLVYGFRLTGPTQEPVLNEPIPPYLDKGIWLVPGKPGSGLMLDWQDDTLVFTIFTYRKDGSPIWYQGSGQIVDGVVDAEAYEFSGGSCWNCEYVGGHRPGEPILTRFEFTSKTTAWLAFDGGEPMPIRAMAFDVPNYRPFGDSASFGQPALYDLRGEWVFVSTKGKERFFKRVTFTDPVRHGSDTVAWQNAAGTISLRCNAKPERFASPQCKLIEFDGETWHRLFSAHWADIGEDQIIAYEERPLSGENDDYRGEELIFGFRLSGPGQH